VTEVMVVSVSPQFHDTPTSMRRFAPVPAVWLKLTLLAVGAPVPLEAAPSTVGQGAATKLAVTVLGASIVTEHSPVPEHAPLQLLKT